MTRGSCTIAVGGRGATGTTQLAKQGAESREIFKGGKTETIRLRKG